MPRRALPLELKVRVCSVAGGFRATVGAGVLLVAVGAAACSPNTSSGRSLPISVSSDSRSLHPSNCTVNASGTQAVASGSFSPSASLPVVDGQQMGALQLQLRVSGSKTFRVGSIVVHNPGLGETVAGVTVGQSSWRLATTLERLPGVRPTRCEVTYGVFG
jgi:hypothetical protein